MITGVHFEVSGMLAWASGYLLNSGGNKDVLANHNYLIAYGSQPAEGRVFHQRSPLEDIDRIINVLYFGTVLERSRLSRYTFISNV